MSTPTNIEGGFYHCERCRKVVEPTALQIEHAEQAPEANPALKCPHCHHHTVYWLLPSPEHAQTPHGRRRHRALVANEAPPSRQLSQEEVHAGFAALRRELDAVPDWKGPAPSFFSRAWLSGGPVTASAGGSPDV